MKHQTGTARTCLKVSGEAANPPTHRVSGNSKSGNDQETLLQTPFWNTRIVRSLPWVCS